MQHPELETPQQVKILLPSRFLYEKIARDAGEMMAEEMEFSEDRVKDLKVVLSEACMNAIEHGNRSDAQKPVTVVLTAFPQKYIEIIVSDLGITQLPTTMPDVDQLAQGSHERGWGLFLISQMADEVEITHLPDGGNQIRIVMYVTPITESMPEKG